MHAPNLCTLPQERNALEMQHGSSQTSDSMDASVSELVRLAIGEAVRQEVDDDAYWSPIHLLQKADASAVWANVEPLARNADPRIRALVPDVLRYLAGPDLPLGFQTVALFKNMLVTESAPEVIASIGCAFVDLSKFEARVDLMLPFSTHPDACVRSAVVHALLASTRPEAIDALIRLSSDVDENVRDWATFGLGSQLDDVDTVAIRDALAARLDDAHEDTRYEALVGLALRKDARAIPR
jgi:hypothetical protein